MPIFILKFTLHVPRRVLLQVLDSSMAKQTVGIAIFWELLFPIFNSFRSIDALRQLLHFAIDALAQSLYFCIVLIFLFINKLTTNDELRS